MLISHRYRFIYLRTIKTASSSIELRLQGACLPDGHPRPPEDCDMVETDAGIIGARRILSEAREFPWWNHMPARQIANQLPAEQWQGYHRFTSIRNPWEKLVSLFWFKLRQSRHEARRERVTKGSFDDARDEFLKWLARHREVPHDGEIYTIDNNVVAQTLIRYENLEADLAALIETLALPESLVEPSTPKLKTGFRRFTAPYQDYFDEPSRQRVAERYARECERFGYAFDSDLQSPASA